MKQQITYLVGCFGSYVYVGLCEDGLVYLPGIPVEEVTHLKTFVGERLPQYEWGHSLCRAADVRESAGSLLDILQEAQESDLTLHASLDGFGFADHAQTVDFIYHSLACAERAEADQRDYERRSALAMCDDPFAG